MQPFIKHEKDIEVNIPPSKLQFLFNKSEQQGRLEPFPDSFVWSVINPTAMSLENKTRAPKGNPQRCKENLQTPYRKAPVI